MVFLVQLATYKPTKSNSFNYASVGRAPRHMAVVVFVCVCVCVCVILQHSFLCDHDELSNETCNATISRHSTTTKLARFLI